jgi:hydroxyacylglutathione hydrolase
MFFRMIYDEKLAQAAYLIGCQQTGEAIVIDPERDVDRYLAIAAKEGLRIVAAAETHIHADFLSGARELAERARVRVYLSDEGDADWKYQWPGGAGGGRSTPTDVPCVKAKPSYEHQQLHDGDVFHVGKIEFRVLHTPGHTPEHICFVVTDRGAGAGEPMGVVTGDFVFVGDLGRPDLLETAVGKGGASESAARRLFQALGRIKALPDWLQVWPGHGAGSACGKALGAVPQSTLGYERRFNTALSAAVSEEAFLRFILQGQPEPPLYFARMKMQNKAGPRVLGELPRPRCMGAEELLKLDTRKVTLIDTRPWGAFKAGHVPGALYCPLNSTFTTDIGSMAAEDADIYLVIDAAMVEEAVRDLVRIGLDRVVGYFEPAVLGQFASRGGKLVGTQEVSEKEARAMIERGQAFVLDVRRAAEFAEGHLDGAVNIAHTRLAGRLEEVPKGRCILVNCRSGGRSGRACALLQRNGFDAVNLEGGFEAWQKGVGA